MRKINPNVIARARPYLFAGGNYLKYFSYMTVKRLARALNISPTIAGCVMTTLGWVSMNPNKSVTNRTYSRS